MVALTLYRRLLCLYPGSYREEFGEEMTSVFRDARGALPPALAVSVSFYGREFSGLLSGALRAHFGRLFGPALSFRRFYMQPQFRFPRSTVFLMLVILPVQSSLSRRPARLPAIRAAGVEYGHHWDPFWHSCC
jgi:hypothetical protein